MNPTITGLIFGSYQIQLKVTDSSGNSSTNTLKYGSVFTDSNDVVIPPQPYLTNILGPLLRLGANPWPYFDISNQAMADFFGGLQSSDYLDIWNQGQQGTISVVNGSTTVTGTGTAFTKAFCGGGAYPVNGAVMIIGYPVPAAPGQWGRAPYSVASCQTDTQITLGTPYNSSSTASGVTFAVMNNTSVGTWIGGSTNANYYDNVMAFYGLYYRSGLDDYLNYARTLADRWYQMPWFDGGRAALSPQTTLFPRLQSLTGIVLRAMDGHPDYWRGIEQYLSFDYSFANVAPIAGSAMGDIREQGYATGFLALGAMYDPNPGMSATFASELNTVLNNAWTPAAQPAGNWMNLTDGFASWNGLTGTASVTNGSNIVTGNGTNWQSGWFNENSFWTANPDGVTGGDPIAYTATVISPTQLQLNTPYQGTTATARGWQANGLVGVGTQPFMLGVVGNAFRYAYLATKDARLPGYITGIESWLATQGYRPDSRGLWYGRAFPNCEPITNANQACSGGAVEPSRFLSGEIVGALSAAYSLTGDASTQAFGDNIYGAMFGGPTGGPNADSTFVTDVQPGGWAVQNKLAKDFGFFFGFGGGANWPAARVSGIAGGGGGNSCTYSVTPTANTIAAAGGTGTIGVTASGPACAWTAVSANAGVAITAGAAGTGSGTASYSVSPNPSPATLTLTLTVAGQTVTLTQLPIACTYALTPGSAGFGNSGGSASIGVTASNAACAWNAVSNSTFATITGGANGTGSGTVSYSVASDMSSARTGTLTVAGLPFTITQSGGGGSDSDIGIPQLAGNASVANGVYAVTGGGSAIWGVYDQFNFYHWQLSGDATITARLVSLTGGGTYAKAGVMMRSTLQSNSPNVFAFGTATKLASEARTSLGGTTAMTGVASAMFPVWLRTVIQGGVVTCYSSPDGQTWTALGPARTLGWSGEQVGLAVSSQNSNATATAVFDNVSITQP